jgi:hypothetical protein
MHNPAAILCNACPSPRCTVDPTWFDQADEISHA